MKTEKQEFALQAAAAIAAGVLLWGGSNALAADPLKTCACLLKECRYVIGNVSSLQERPFSQANAENPQLEKSQTCVGFAKE